MSGKATKRFNNGGNKSGPKLEIGLLKGGNFYNKTAKVDVLYSDPRIEMALICIISNLPCKRFAPRSHCLIVRVNLVVTGLLHCC